VNYQSCEQILKSVLWKTVAMEEEFPNEFQLYVLPKDDIAFVKKQLEKNETDDELLVDSLSKLFIAFYFDSIPGQIIDNLKTYPNSNSKKEKTGEYFLSLAGLLHEVKITIVECSEIFIPYLTAYEEFVGGSNGTPTSEDILLENFKNNVENAIQAIITF
jgi:hypothetical protein